MPAGPWHHTRAILAAALILAVAAPAIAPTVASAQADPAPNGSTPASCDSALAAAPSLSGGALFEGAFACNAEERAADTTLLLILGQIRGLTDLAVLPPVDGADEPAATNLFAALYSYGGLGAAETFRDPERVEALVERVNATDIAFTEGYSPGWAYKPTAKTHLYDHYARTTRAQRLWQMRSFAQDIQNDEYYAAYTALQALHRDHPVLAQGTPEAEESRRLNALMRAAEASIPALPKPVDTFPHGLLREADPAMEAVTLAKGFNGPEKGSTHIFRSAEELAASWVPATLSQGAWQTLLSEVDFRTQVIIGRTFGRRRNASGRIQIDQLDYSERADGYRFFISVGQIDADCGEPEAHAYPFILGVAEAVPGARIRSTGASNFPDTCGPPVSAEPTPVP